MNEKSEIIYLVGYLNANVNRMLKSFLWKMLLMLLKHGCQSM